MGTTVATTTSTNRSLVIAPPIYNPRMALLWSFILNAAFGTYLRAGQIIPLRGTVTDPDRGVMQSITKGTAALLLQGRSDPRNGSPNPPSSTTYARRR
jgi:hypothetical protein